MRYYSDVTQKFYGTEDEAKVAEADALTIKSKKKERAEELRKAYDRVQDAEREYLKLKEKYEADYGGYSSLSIIPALLTDFLRF